MYTEAYLQYLIHFHATRDYFECHEILEEHWKKGGKTEAVWVGLIQIAVALYHYRRENITGAIRMLEFAIKNIKENPVDSLGINQTQLLLLLNELKNNCTISIPYKDIDLPINDSKLLTECKIRCAQLNLSWGSTSDMTDMFLIHKHKLRDRSAVIEERKRNLESKRNI